MSALELKKKCPSICSILSQSIDEMISIHKDLIDNGNFFDGKFRIMFPRFFDTPLHYYFFCIFYFATLNDIPDNELISLRRIICYYTSEITLNGTTHGPIFNIRFRNGDFYVYSENTKTETKTTVLEIFANGMDSNLFNDKFRDYQNSSTLYKIRQMVYSQFKPSNKTNNDGIFIDPIDGTLIVDQKSYTEFLGIYYNYDSLIKLLILNDNDPSINHLPFTSNEIELILLDLSTKYLEPDEISLLKGPLSLKVIRNYLKNCSLNDLFFDYYEILTIAHSKTKNLTLYKELTLLKTLCRHKIYGKMTSLVRLIPNQESIPDNF